MPGTPKSHVRRSSRTKVGRRADEIRRALGRHLVALRLDASVSQRQLTAACGVPQSFLSMIEHGKAEPSIAVLVAIGDALDADISIRFYPGSGSRIRDRFQAPIAEALLSRSRRAWRGIVEVPVWRPVRGVIDVALARPGEVVVATEIHSEVRRLEQQLRWAAQKAESLPSCDAWSMLSGGDAATPVSRLLVLRSTRANRELARQFEATLQAAFPSRAVDAVAALGDPRTPWPGAAIIWADVIGGVARILDGPPRSVRLGR